MKIVLLYACGLFVYQCYRLTVSCVRLLQMKREVLQYQDSEIILVI